MKKLIWGLLGLLAGRRSMQGFYEGLLNVALDGMNYGRGGDFRTSGELPALRHIRAALKGEPALTVFDVGANIGEYSVELARFFGPASTVHAFEPSAATFARLQATVAGQPNVKAHALGFSDAPGTLKLYRHPERHTLASLYPRDLERYNLKLDQVEEIRLGTIDAFCAEHGIARLHFLKIDIEGHELSALKGAQRMIAEGCIDFIQFEFGGANIDSRTYFRDFFNLLSPAFRIHRIVRDGLRPIERYSESCEQFHTINYLAEKR